MNNTPVLTGASPVLPALDLPATIQFYEEKLGFRARVREDEFAILRRDGVDIHFWKCADQKLADNSSCRLTVRNIDALYETCQAAGIVHPDARLETKPWGIREFAVTDLNGCRLWFREPVEHPRPVRPLELHFAPYVFAGTRFPDCEFEQPSLVEELIGPATIRTTFYDAEYQPVTSAERPGRYGAVVEIEAADGRIFKRFRTLFRRPDSGTGRILQPVRPVFRTSYPEPVWVGRKGPFPVEFSPELGIDPEVVREQGTTLFEYFRGRRQLLDDPRTLEDAYCDDPWTPILLAGLTETPTGSGDTYRNSAWDRDRRWWFGLKQRLGEAHTPHLIYLPRQYDQDGEGRWPLVLFLHGSGAVGADLDQLRKGGLAGLAEEGRPFPFILVVPQCPADEWFWPPVALNALLDEVSARYRVDPDRVYATGLSMGGRGTWDVAIETPDRFAAIAPICGSIPAVEDVSRIRHLPVWAFLGAKDADPSIRTMVEALQAIGGNARLTVYPDAGHDAWTPTYADPVFYEWLLSQRRVPRSD
jgi:uncharacterized glyoxalase superfamily protein PhnB